MARTKPTQRDAFEAVAQSLRDFGYPITTQEMIRDVWLAMLDKKELPHGVIGAFAEQQLSEHRGMIWSLEP